MNTENDKSGINHKGPMPGAGARVGMEMPPPRHQGHQAAPSHRARVRRRRLPAQPEVIPGAPGSRPKKRSPGAPGILPVLNEWQSPMVAGMVAPPEGPRFSWCPWCLGGDQFRSGGVYLLGEHKGAQRKATAFPLLFFAPSRPLGIGCADTQDRLNYRVGCVDRF